ncbi:hypothetical protein MKX08_000414 [Trichoderma sp. CBMAI-0020]|nr:hypothetical protein MKX08_000414 [Trichoderma sp. CBMAI-0020]
MFLHLIEQLADLMNARQSYRGDQALEAGLELTCSICGCAGNVQAMDPRLGINWSLQLIDEGHSRVLDEPGHPTACVFLDFTTRRRDRILGNVGGRQRTRIDHHVVAASTYDDWMRGAYLIELLNGWQSLLWKIELLPVRRCEDPFSRLGFCDAAANQIQYLAKILCFMDRNIDMHLCSKHEMGVSIVKSRKHGRVRLVNDTSVGSNQIIQAILAV